MVHDFSMQYFRDFAERIRDAYRTPDDIAGEFYIPLLSVACRYDRGAGFFSSGVLIEIARGMVRFMQRGGQARLITSPYFQEEDLQAIRAGYAQRQDVVERALMRQWHEPHSDDERERLNFLAHMVASGQLDIKVAFRPDGMYHEKFGILFDEAGDAVAFSGSLNESLQAVSHNFEAIDVFTSWHDAARTGRKIRDFNNTWNNQTDSLEVVSFPAVARERLMSYRRPSFSQHPDARPVQPAQVPAQEDMTAAAAPPLNTPALPPERLRDYQLQAIDAWAAHGYRGIFDMATGTGKTYTGLGALVALHQHCRGNLAAVICCPFLHLAEQWAEELTRFNIRPIIGHSSSPQKNWKERLQKEIGFHNDLGTFFCLLTVNRTFASPFVQEQLGRIGGQALLLADEAHYFGAQHLMRRLPQHFEYRLALSATIERHDDEEGTQALSAYFGEKCIEFTLREAIAQGMLTPYDYHPVAVYLTADELGEYKDLSARIARQIAAADAGRRRRHDTLPDGARMLLLRRARLIAGAAAKLPALLQIMEMLRQEHHMLIYCGAVSVDDGHRQDEEEQEDVRQISAVCRALHEKFDMRVTTFTSRENARERDAIRRMFARGETQALVAIRCLDEGFNLPAIHTAFILASSTNPKEYIQRRGRVLRLAEGKDHAVIYDFITLPRPPGEYAALSDQERRYERGLVQRELTRLLEFNDLARNRYRNESELIWQLKDVFGHELNREYDNLI